MTEAPPSSSDIALLLPVRRLFPSAIALLRLTISSRRNVVASLQQWIQSSLKHSSVWKYWTRMQKQNNQTKFSRLSSELSRSNTSGSGVNVSPILISPQNSLSLLTTLYAAGGRLPSVNTGSKQMLHIGHTQVNQTKAAPDRTGCNFLWSDRILKNHNETLTLLLRQNHPHWSYLSPWFSNEVRKHHLRRWIERFHSILV